MKASLLTVSLGLIAGGILIQALLAGMFISGTGAARMTHLVVGASLPYLAIFPTVSAWQRSRRDVLPAWVAPGATALMIGLWVQEGLGHMPFPVSTTIHVPLGVLLFAFSLALTFTAATTPSRRVDP